MNKALSPAMRKALISARDHDAPGYHLSGQSEFGGFNGTRFALINRGYLDRQHNITDAGRQAIADQPLCFCIPRKGNAA